MNFVARENKVWIGNSFFKKRQKHSSLQEKAFKKNILRMTRERDGRWIFQSRLRTVSWAFSLLLVSECDHLNYVSAHSSEGRGGAVAWKKGARQTGHQKNVAEEGKQAR